MDSEERSSFGRRKERLTGLLRQAGLGALALTPGPTLQYLTGLRFHLGERPIAALFRVESPPVMILPEMEGGRAEALPFPVRVHTYGEDPSSWPEAFQRALRDELQGEQIGYEPVRMRALELRLLEASAPWARFRPAEKALAPLRVCKGPEELAALRKAVVVAERAMEALLPRIEPGMTEKEIAGELTVALLRSGAETELPFQPIVSAGPNSANPHAIPTDRTVQAGELLLLDWGATVNGYCSDLTRVFTVGDVDDELLEIAGIVREANAAARAAVAPGVPVREVDQAARSVIDAAGYGECFVHRVGHGIGLEIHEPPYLRSDNAEELAEGMTFTIEPGVYLPGRGGVRIEDDVVVTGEGGETLSSFPRALRSVA